jgi:hypothetical protein
VNILGKSFSKRELERRTGNLQQIRGTRHFEYSAGWARGVQVIEEVTAGIRKVLELKSSKRKE